MFDRNTTKHEIRDSEVVLALAAHILKLEQYRED